MAKPFRRLRLRFWLRAADVAYWLTEISRDRFRRVYLWTVGKASDVEWEDYRV